MKSPLRWIALAAAALAVAQDAVALVGPWQQNPHSQVRLLTPYAVAAREGPFELGFEFHLTPGWHAYWRNSGDAGFPPTFDLRRTPQLSSPIIHWPAPNRYAMPGDLVAFGYADEVVYPVSAELRAVGDSLLLLLTADYLVCEVECVPYRVDLELRQPLAATASPDPDTAARLATWRQRVPRPADADRLQAHIEAAEEEFALVARYPGATGGDVEFFPDSHTVFEFGAASVTAGQTGLVLTVPLARKDKTAALPQDTTLSWVLTGLAEGPIEARVSRELPRPSVRQNTVGWAIGLAVLVAILAALGTVARGSRRTSKPEGESNS
jgi:DsbC/DsbD-like thiol-disulfide interchange protein